MGNKVETVLNALIAVLALVAAVLRFLDGEVLFPAILLLLAVLNAAALVLRLRKTKENGKPKGGPDP